MTELAEWIAALAAADVSTRVRAAEALYRAGRELADPIIALWQRDPQFAGLLTGVPTVGIAVRPETFDRIRAAWAMPPLADVPAEHDAREFELRSDEARLDILTPRDPAAARGAIAQFLARKGEGIQQVEYPVKDVERATARLVALGETPVYPAARAGADGSRVNFFLATAPDGRRALIELVEPRASGLADGGWGE